MQEEYFNLFVHLSNYFIILKYIFILSYFKYKLRHLITLINHFDQIIIILIFLIR